MHQELQIKQSLIARWRLGGTETLVKVMDARLAPDPSRPIGYCTEIKFLAGRIPLAIERAVGLRDKTKLVAGAAIYAVTPLPRPAEFKFAGYSNTPEGISTSVKLAHPDYPPGLGVPQWNLDGLSQANLQLLTKIGPSEAFTFQAKTLGPWA